MLIVGLLFLAAQDLWIIGVVSIAFALLVLWGSPRVVVNTAGRDMNAAEGWPWQQNEASQFVEALRARLFDEKSAAT